MTDMGFHEAWPRRFAKFSLPSPKRKGDEAQHDNQQY